MLEDEQDAYGHELYDYLNGKDVYEIVERDDGYFDVSSGPPLYFSAYDQWPDYEKKAIDYVRGKVLDIGCGAGRHPATGERLEGGRLAIRRLRCDRRRGGVRTRRARNLWLGAGGAPIPAALVPGFLALRPDDARGLWARGLGVRPGGVVLRPFG